MSWPAELAARYRADGHWLDRTLDHWLDAVGQPDRIALVSGEHRISYRELAAHVERLAAGLLERGLRRGDRILVQLPNRWEFVALLLACLRTGVQPVLTLPAHRYSELRYLARHAEARMIVVPDRWRDFDHAAMAERVANGLDWPCEVVVVGDVLPAALLAEPTTVVNRPEPDDIAFFLLSGGTTGTPKMIGRTHNDYDCHIRSTSGHTAIGTDTVYLAVLPAAHNFPLCPGILGTLVAGGTVVLALSPEPSAAFAIMARESVTMTSVVPAIARRWVEAVATFGRPSSLELVQIGGSVLDADLADAVSSALGCRIQQVFGMAEGLISYTRPDDPDDVVRGTQGRPVCVADEIRIVDEDDREVSPSEVGELLTRGPYTTCGYYRSPEHNARAFTPDGWYRTGDLVRLHPTGNLVVAGRRKDLINRAGEKVSADEVEQLALDLFDLAGVAAIPVPDRTVGERVCLVVVARDTAPTLAQVRDAFTAHGVANYKVPEQLEVLGALPLTPVGKVDKKALRASLVTA